MIASATLKKAPRQFLPEDFKLTTWENIQSYFEELKTRNITSNEDLLQWLRDISELEAVISVDASWRQINMTRDTSNKAYFPLVFIKKVFSGRKFFFSGFTKTFITFLF